MAKNDSDMQRFRDGVPASEPDYKFPVKEVKYASVSKASPKVDSKLDGKDYNKFTEGK